MSSISLIAQNLVCTRQERVLFRALSFELTSSTLLLVEGANGAGKSSLLRLLAGLMPPDEGDIQWLQQSIQQCRAEYASQLHYLGHLNGNKLALTVTENLRLHSQLVGMSVHFDAVLDHLQLSTYHATPLYQLSAGQQRRVALARLLLYPKPIWIVDEPLTALDQRSQHYFLAQLADHLTKGGIAIMSSHHPITLPNITPHYIRLGTC